MILRKILPPALLAALVVPVAPLKADGSDQVECPATISTKQQIQVIPPGWQVVDRPTKNMLSEVNVFAGPPSKKLALKYDSEEQRNGQEVLIWRLNSVDEHWLQCGYFGTSVSLVKRVSAGSTECKARRVHGRKVWAEAACR